MSYLTLIIISVCLFFTAACTPWPPKGSGGIGEHHKEDAFNQPDYLAIKLAEHHLDILILEGAKQCFPASVVQAMLLQKRITREWLGGLYSDAANDLIIQHEKLAILERQLDAVKGQISCISSNEVKPVDNTKNAQSFNDKSASEHILSLLNSDNQFASNSAEINPKYQKRLTEAAQQLKHKSRLKLIITGHSDQLGDDQYNQQLSLARAYSVGNYLQSHGIDKQNIQYLAKGSNQPLFTGLAPHVRLTNRRVTIQLITNHKIYEMGE